MKSLVAILACLSIVGIACKSRTKGSSSGLKELYSSDNTGYFYAGSPQADHNGAFDDHHSELTAFASELSLLGYKSHIRQSLDRAGYLQLARDAAINTPAGGSLIFVFAGHGSEDGATYHGNDRRGISASEIIDTMITARGSQRPLKRLIFWMTTCYAGSQMISQSRIDQLSGSLYEEGYFFYPWKMSITATVHFGKIFDLDSNVGELVNKYGRAHYREFEGVEGLTFVEPFVMVAPSRSRELLLSQPAVKFKDSVQGLIHADFGSFDFYSKANDSICQTDAQCIVAYLVAMKSGMKIVRATAMPSHVEAPSYPVIFVNADGKTVSLRASEFGLATFPASYTKNTFDVLMTPSGNNVFAFRIADDRMQVRKNLSEFLSLADIKRALPASGIVLREESTANGRVAFVKLSRADLSAFENGLQAIVQRNKDSFLAKNQETNHIFRIWITANDSSSQIMEKLRASGLKYRVIDKTDLSILLEMTPRSAKRLRDEFDVFTYFVESKG